MTISPTIPFTGEGESPAGTLSPSIANAVIMFIFELFSLLLWLFGYAPFVAVSGLRFTKFDF